MSRTRLRSQSNQTGIPEDALDRMERAFHADFRNVRVSETLAAKDLGAVAFTQGSDIQFAPGQFNPGTTAGLEVLGHELAHVLQQHEGRAVGVQAKGVPVLLDNGHEREADVLGARAARGEVVVALEGPVRQPARTTSGVIQAMFEPGELYRVRRKVGRLAVDEIVIMRSKSTTHYKVIRDHDDEEFTITNAKATKANFEKLKQSPDDDNYMPPLPSPALPHGQPAPTRHEPAELVTKGRGNNKHETFDAAFARVLLSKVDFSKLPFPREVFGAQESIDRAALTLAEEAVRNGFGFVDEVVDEMTGRKRKQLFIADVWSGRYVAYEESDKDHLMNQREIMNQLAALSKYANRGDFERRRAQGLLQRTGADLVEVKGKRKRKRQWRVSKATVDTQYGNPDNLGISGKALNQRTKNDQSVWETLRASLLHSNVPRHYDGKSMVGKNGQVLGREIKDNLTKGANKHYLHQNKRIRLMTNLASGQATLSRGSQLHANELRGVDDASADRHEAHADTRSRKLALETGAFELIAGEVSSESEDHLPEIEERLVHNMKRTIRGIRKGKEVDIKGLRHALDEKAQELDLAGEAVDDTERRARAAEARVDELTDENQSLKDENQSLKDEIDRLKAQLKIGGHAGKPRQAAATSAPRRASRRSRARGGTSNRDF